jgi:cytochrome P450
VSTAAALPPGPRLPRWAQTAGFILFPVPFVDACRRRYGDIVTFRSLFDPCFVMVFSPGLVKQVFRGSPERLRAGEANALLAPIVGNRSVLLLDGAEHMRRRRLLLPPFHGERMRAYEQVMLEAADRAIDSWPADDDGSEFTLLSSMQALTLEVIERAVFGVDDGERRAELTERVRALLDPVTSRRQVLLLVLTGGRRGAGAGKQFLEARRRLDELLFAEIAHRRRQPDLAEREDVLSMLLHAGAARSDTGEREEPMTDAELRDELLTLLVAGHETTATGLAWAFELLMRNPRVLRTLRASLDEGDTAYLDAVIKETLRLRPVISGVGRKVREEPFELGGYMMPVGIEINPSIAAIHRRADSYPEPGEFRPERHLAAGAPDGYTWLPFGGGTRRCLGASFANFEMRVVIRRVLERTELVPAAKPETGVRRGIVFVPRNGVRVRARSVVS